MISIIHLLNTCRFLGSCWCLGGLVFKQNLSPKAAPAIQPLRGAMNPIDNFLATAGNWGTVGEKLPDCTDVIVAPWNSLAKTVLRWIMLYCKKWFELETLAALACVSNWLGSCEKARRALGQRVEGHPSQLLALLGELNPWNFLLFSQELSRGCPTNNGRRCGRLHQLMSSDSYITVWKHYRMYIP